MAASDQHIVEVLRETGLLTQQQLDEITAAAEAEGHSIVETLLARGILTQKQISLAMANAYGMAFVDLSGIKLEKEILDLVPRHVANRYKIVPLERQNGSIVVAVSDPTNIDTLDALRYILKCDIEARVATQEDIESALNSFYGTADEHVEKMLQEATEAEIKVSDVAKSRLEDADGGAGEEDAPIIKLVSLIILEAYKTRASDIHLEPMEKRFRVRYRVDGMLYEVENPPKRLQGAIINRLKIMAKMNLAERRIPQDGRIQINVMGRDLDLRVSCLPSSHGETIVMRILDKSSLLLGLPDLGFLSDDQATFERLIALPDGILLVTGPTGSGKTTTLYAVLNYINKPDRKIMTIEDPVEYQLAGINQVHVREDVGMTFAMGLRSMLRQAPNIIMLGEIRDMETASIAINASLTGHLVFSTLHTNDAPSAVTRLMDIGIKPFLVASSIRGIMAQRLVRCICKNCKEEVAPTEDEMRILKIPPDQRDTVKLFRGKGCATCKKSGYKGRKGIFEMFVLTDEIRNMIYEKVSSHLLRQRARELGMRTLREDGLRKVLTGMTTLEEVVSITMADTD